MTYEATAHFVEPVECRVADCEEKEGEETLNGIGGLWYPLTAN